MALSQPVDGPAAVAFPGPLEGIKVIDLTAMLAGPYSTMLLADLGADVVKIEPPTGDMSRQAGPFRSSDGPAALGGAFQSVNRGKRSVVLNLKDSVDVSRFLGLVRIADAVVENFTASVMDGFGLGYERLAEENPRIVYAAIRGFGDPRTGASPYVNWPAFDVVAQAMGGFLSITGTPDGTPVKSGPGVGDLFPGALLALGIVSAVRHAERTGKGQFVDVSMYDAVLSLCERIVFQYSYLDQIPTPIGNQHPFLCPFGVFRTGTGWVAVAAPKDQQWQTLAAIIGRPELGDDPRFRRNTDRVRNSDDVRTVLEDWLCKHSNEEVAAALGGKVPMGPVNDVASIFSDPHVEAREMLIELPQPGSSEPVVVAGQPIKFSQTRGGPKRRAPMLGEDVLDEIVADWSKATIR